MAKTASKNSPSQRKEAVYATWKGKQVVKIRAHIIVNDKTKIVYYVAYKEDAAAMKPDLFIKEDGRLITWEDVRAAREKLKTYI